MGKHGEQLRKLLTEHFGNEPIEGVEIGAGSGIVTQVILSLPNVQLLWAIDSWEHRPDDAFEAGDRDQDWHNQRLHAAIDRMKGQQPTGRVIICWMGSDAAWDILHEQASAGTFVDFVWIDGHHTEEQVRRDIQNYRALVEPGGLIGGHDYGTNEVQQVVDEEFADCEIHLGDDTTWWVFL